MVRSLSLVTVLALLGACASSMSTVPVRGDADDIARLAGEWKGQFEGVNNSRRGTIDFNFAMGRHTADAKVIMQVDGKPLRLAVANLQIDDAQVRGTIEPYVDPTCNCRIETKFEGALSSGFMVGTYSVHPDGAAPRTGNWSAERIDD